MRSAVQFTISPPRKVTSLNNTFTKQNSPSNKSSIDDEVFVDNKFGAEMTPRTPPSGNPHQVPVTGANLHPNLLPPASVAGHQGQVINQPPNNGIVGQVHNPNTNNLQQQAGVHSLNSGAPNANGSIQGASHVSGQGNGQLNSHLAPQQQQGNGSNPHYSFGSFSGGIGTPPIPPGLNQPLLTMGGTTMVTQSQPVFVHPSVLGGATAQFGAPFPSGNQYGQFNGPNTNQFGNQTAYINIPGQQPIRVQPIHPSTIYGASNGQNPNFMVHQQPLNQGNFNQGNFNQISPSVTPNGNSSGSTLNQGVLDLMQAMQNMKSKGQRTLEAMPLFERVPKMTMNGSIDEYIKSVDGIIRDNILAQDQASALLLGFDSQAMIHFQHQEESAGFVSLEYNNAKKTLRTIFPEKSYEEKKRLMKSTGQQYNESPTDYFNRKVVEAYQLGLALDSRFYKTVTKGLKNKELKEHLMWKMASPNFETRQFGRYLASYNDLVPQSSNQITPRSSGATQALPEGKSPRSNSVDSRRDPKVAFTNNQKVSSKLRPGLPLQRPHLAHRRVKNTSLATHVNKKDIMHMNVQTRQKPTK